MINMEGKCPRWRLPRAESIIKSQKGVDSDGGCEIGLFLGRQEVWR